MHVFDGPVLSEVWAEGFLAVSGAPYGELSRVSMSVTGFTAESAPLENPTIRQAIDESLSTRGGHSCETVANTIFPRSLWNPSKAGELVYERFNRIFPRIRAYPGNHDGTYFGRMVNYGRNSPGSGFNQIAHVIESWRRGNHRRSALQICIFNPLADHSHQRQKGFPCLHQVALAPTRNRGLEVTGFYATQYIHERAYGNLLGLSRLGAFLAHEMDLRLERVTCVAQTELLGRICKRDSSELQVQLRHILTQGGND